jgi:hypothetical protein
MRRVRAKAGVNRGSNLLLATIKAPIERARAKVMSLKISSLSRLPPTVFSAPDTATSPPHLWSMWALCGASPPIRRRLSATTTGSPILSTICELFRSTSLARDVLMNGCHDESSDAELPSLEEVPGGKPNLIDPTFDSEFEVS